MVVCTHCGHESADRSFCDRCNALLPSSAQRALPARVSAEGYEVDCAGWHGSWPADCFRSLLTTLVSTSDPGRVIPCRAYALNRSWWRDLGEHVRKRAAVQLPLLAPLRILPHGEGAIVVAETLPNGSPAPIQDPPADVFVLSAAALTACERLARVVETLHQAGYVWLNFDPLAMEIAGENLRITNLDLQLFVVGSCPESLRLSAAYSPPELTSFNGERIGPGADVFHLALFAYYYIAGLLPAGFNGGGLEAFDFAIPPLRIYRPHLPVGIAPVIERALAREPSERHSSVAMFLQDFRSALERSRRNQTGQPVQYTAGAASVIGRTHTIMGLPNQDCHAIVPMGNGALLCVVTDGVTHALVGSGDEASQLAIATITAELPDALDRAKNPAEADEAVRAAFYSAGQRILNAAAAQLVDPVHINDLMSSTALVAVLRGPEVLLASLGDSRAYLVRDRRAEQLTVDGDVRCTHLAAGGAPEEVRDMGAEAGALYGCVGVGELVDDQLIVSTQRGRASLSRWILQPGDILILCSDGLVEEGAFLSPEELPLLLAEVTDHTPAEQAAHLVAAAAARHRDPAPWEPEGFGDDVTCIVVAVSKAGLPEPELDLGMGSADEA